MKNCKGFYGNIKTRIQENIEYNQELYAVKQYIRGIDEKYDIENAVFGYDFGARKLDELKEGYLDIAGTYSTMNEALENMTRVDECVHVVRNSDGHTYRLGRWCGNMSDCTGDTVMDIERLHDVKISA